MSALHQLLFATLLAAFAFYEVTSSPVEAVRASRSKLRSLLTAKANTHALIDVGPFSGQDYQDCLNRCQKDFQQCSQQCGGSDNKPCITECDRLAARCETECNRFSDDKA